jgi:hypothetical protein
MQITGHRLVFAALLSAIVTPSAAGPSFVGIWYGAYQPDEPNVMSMIEFRADGSFREEFRKCEHGEVVGYYYETGTWSFVDGVERTMTNRINGQPAQSEGTYVVDVLTDTERRIHLQEKGLVFVSHRVAKFEFPACATGA